MSSSIPRVTILAFGITSFASGIASLVSPASMLEALDLPSGAIPAVKGNALAAVAMGIYYTLAAYQNNAAFFAATVPMRLLTAAVFWGQDWKAASIWEGAGAGLTAAALLSSWKPMRKSGGADGHRFGRRE
ncbi:hypothetical protein Trco_001880 [Trichoderma cornu-damae]|uniref:Uncharacterized protein n=1 Tax=Trichoderma cornu-damae TaxID=654480 RepID=A0A9P8QNT1_9HYPO|nr:hypothetical protein Trco_001880 [Trichoderma cornu-damae]